MQTTHGTNECNVQANVWTRRHDSRSVFVYLAHQQTELDAVMQRHLVVARLTVYRMPSDATPKIANHRRCLVNANQMHCQVDKIALTHNLHKNKWYDEVSICFIHIMETNNIVCQLEESIKLCLAVVYMNAFCLQPWINSVHIGFFSQWVFVTAIISQLV